MDKMEKASEKKKGFVKEFVDFLQTFGVIGLAIGFVIGVASSAVVNSLVKDIINPIVGLVLPTGNLSSLNATVTSPVSGKPSVFLRRLHLTDHILHHNRAGGLRHVQAAQAIRTRQDVGTLGALFEPLL